MPSPPFAGRLHTVGPTDHLHLEEQKKAPQRKNLILKSRNKYKDNRP